MAAVPVVLACALYPLRPCAPLQLEGVMDVAAFLATLVDCHQEALAEQWAASLGRDQQVPVT